MGGNKQVTYAMIHSDNCYRDNKAEKGETVGFVVLNTVVQ